MPSFLGGFCLGKSEKHTLGDSRKYPYQTTGGILEFRGKGGVSWTGIGKTWGGNALSNSKGMGLLE